MREIDFVPRTAHEGEEIQTTEERLRAEVEDLKRQLQEQRDLSRSSQAHPVELKPPSRRALWTMAFMAVVLVIAGFLTGYLPRQRRETLLSVEAQANSQALPTVSVVKVEPSSSTSELVLPGNIQAATEAPILARASGYVKRRYADIGDRVHAGQLLAAIEAPELGQQVQQAKATQEQAASALEQSLANLQQGRTNEQLARVTAQRWANLAAKGVVSRQENDTYQAQYESQQASVQALEKAVAAARSNLVAVGANLARLTELLGYQNVTAPFDGVITVRNVDTGALITEGSTLLFRIAQTGQLRTYVNLPQVNAQWVKVGQPAYLTIADLPGRRFAGNVTRTSNALDPTSRTLLVEVQVPNKDGALMPGMYALVALATPRQNPPLLIRGDALIVRADGPQVATVSGDQTVHFQRITVGRDYGDKIEVTSGLTAGQVVVVNPGDTVKEGARVNAALLSEKPTQKSPPAGGKPSS